MANKEAYLARPSRKEDRDIQRARILLEEQIVDEIELGTEVDRCITGEVQHKCGIPEVGLHLPGTGRTNLYSERRSRFNYYSARQFSFDKDVQRVGVVEVHGSLHSGTLSGISLGQMSISKMLLLS